jgi:hypothetical protein
MTPLIGHREKHLRRSEPWQYNNRLGQTAMDCHAAKWRLAMTAGVDDGRKGEAAYTLPALNKTSKLQTQ